MLYSSPWSLLQLVVACGKKVIRRVSLSVRLLMPSAMHLTVFMSVITLYHRKKN